MGVSAQISSGVVRSWAVGFRRVPGLGTSLGLVHKPNKKHRTSLNLIHHVWRLQEGNWRQLEETQKVIHLLVRGQKNPVAPQRLKTRPERPLQLDPWRLGWIHSCCGSPCMSHLGPVLGNFHLVKKICYSPLLALKGTYHYWKYVFVLCFCPGDLSKQWRASGW